jgi:hypothetical protein
VWWEVLQYRTQPCIAPGALIIVHSTCAVSLEGAVYVHVLGMYRPAQTVGMRFGSCSCFTVGVLRVAGVSRDVSFPKALMISGLVVTVLWASSPPSSVVA